MECWGRLYDLQIGDVLAEIRAGDNNVFVSRFVCEGSLNSNLDKKSFSTIFSDIAIKKALHVVRYLNT